jgi:phosphopantothenoylcysteine decarboxylase/phosphopantothenate--cysteine ligase
VLGVTGSIAAYKALEIVRRLREGNALLSVIMTRAAQELIRPLAFESVSGNRVYTDMFAKERPAGISPRGASSHWQMEHIGLAQSADLVLVAPASGNIIGKVAGGIADDLLSTVIMATKAPVMLAPAMNSEMWTNPVVQANVVRLKALGYRFVGPESGALACGTEGPGRLAGVETICQAVWDCLGPEGLAHLGVLAGKTVVVTTGRTEEAIDPVRVITNRSSGKMGFALARAAQAEGARVKLVSGKTSLPPPDGLDVSQVTTTKEMLAAVRQLLSEADLLFMVAACADFRPRAQSPKKRKDQALTLELERTPDILAELAREGARTVRIGFALESRNLLAHARDKLRKKSLDLIVANTPATLDQDEIQATLVFGTGRIERLPRQGKQDFAARLVREAAALLEKKGPARK